MRFSSPSLGLREGGTAGSSVCSDHGGMTLIEVLIAIMLFAVFSGVFVVVSEMLATLLPSSPTSSLDKASCDGPALELACINIAFDEIQPILEESAAMDLSVRDKQCYSSPSEIPGLAAIAINWPASYDICTFRYPGLLSDVGNPDLYLLQAQPASGADDAFWRIPVQRLFCWPYHRCVKPPKP